MTRAVTGRRVGFTLVELLVAIGIIGILSGLLLGVAAVAAGTAREARTQSLIARLHTLLIERYDQYRYQRVDVSDRAVDQLGVGVATDGYSDSAGLFVNDLDSRQYGAAARVAALRELMKLEMPDRWSDLIGQAVPATPKMQRARRPGAGDTIDTGDSVFLDSVPLLFLDSAPPAWSAYVRAYNNLIGRTNTVTGSTNTAEDITANQGAELLYLTIIHTTGDGEARSLFKESDLGDTDGDGAPRIRRRLGQPDLVPPLGARLRVGRAAQRARPPTTSTATRRRDTNDNGLSGPDAVVNAVLADHRPLRPIPHRQPERERRRVQLQRDKRTTPGYRGWRLVPLILLATVLMRRSGLADGRVQTTGNV